MQGISHSFGPQQVLDDVSLHVEQGLIACLLGPSGCGKTTLLRIAAGLEPLQKGRVEIDDRIVAEAGLAELPPEARNVGLMFQDYALFPHLTVLENVKFGIGAPAQDRKTWTDSALERMGLIGFSGRYPHELSGGQQQRVALLRALAPEPSILLLDEPFSGLDVTRRAQVREQTHDLLKESGHTALMVTHDPEEAMFMSDQLLVMDDGRIVQTGDPIQIYRHPISAFVASLFGPINRISAVTETDGRVETALGTFSVTGIPPGTLVEVLVRPEGLHEIKDSENPATSTVRLRIVTARPIGRSTQLRIVDENTPNMDDAFHARIPGLFLPTPGSLVDFRVDESQVFVFPATTRQ
ncbi:MAG: ABC transporter ATP-binding protein [Alphaproteobacteria bacterium]|nr:ABC transporter ATP-binding protein [Alphaproteobacteria bacterium]